MHLQRIGAAESQAQVASFLQCKSYVFFPAGLSHRYAYVHRNNKRRVCVCEFAVFADLLAEYMFFFSCQRD